MKAIRAVACAALLCLVAAEPGANAQTAALGAPALAFSAPPPPPSGAPALSFSDTDILEQPSYFRLRSLATRYTHFEQWGQGFQSRVGPPGLPGSERLTVEQPQMEAVIEQGDKITHRFWVPVDIVTAASSDAIDVLASASRANEAGAIDWGITYGEKTSTPITARGGFHAEENYRSYSFGLSGVMSLAEDNTVLQASGQQLLDWFDRYTFGGGHDGHAPRSATNASAGITQILSPWTIAYLDYGITYQQGQLSNTFNTVPYANAERIIEVMPASRTRHALVGRVAEWLPWNGSLKASYRLYADDWGITAHSAEFELDQRLHPFFYIGALYRIHTQTAARFYTERLASEVPIRTADSDLAAFDAHTVGGKVAMDLPISYGNWKRLHVDVEVERYFRTNRLEVMVYTCEVGISR